MAARFAWVLLSKYCRGCLWLALCFTYSSSPNALYLLLLPQPKRQRTASGFLYRSTRYSGWVGFPIRNRLSRMLDNDYDYDNDNDNEPPRDFCTAPLGTQDGLDFLSVSLYRYNGRTGSQQPPSERYVRDSVSAQRGLQSRPIGVFCVTTNRDDPCTAC
jgi:hypothetical protein